ncbi:hypothetical protein PV05_10676 [Exophiala xenobiotica]|uniref:Major facilitator superfamily (MFS) profile domain-containing protein n=1 Tax=Exophiala xenobiotica TaxID=348802 RepID=A0A0D2EW26_9EURO|nr:uncharacterized protein PV05_10676 [Exophiala xenobiotica]KIW52014.1 hypothetical protein PV05_10676 [Exophiala xenobiotica]
MEHPVYDDSNFNSTKEGLQAFTAPIEVSVHHGDVDWTVAEETAVRRKFDMVVTPLCTVLYLCRAVDRSAIGNAKIEGMEDDIGLVGYQYNIVLTIFFCMYFAVEVPSNITLKHVGPKWYLPGLVFGFGLVSLCTAFVQSYAGLAVARAFLGIFEGGAMPAVTFILSCFYKKKELFLRMSLFIASSSLANSFGGLLAADLSEIPRWGTNSAPIHTWRNIFFFEGLMTMIIAASAPWFLPQGPASATFLTPRQRYIAAERMHREIAIQPNQRVSWDHVKSAIFNVHTQVCAWTFFCSNAAVQGFGAFVPSILEAFGWTSTEAQLKSVPPYLVACVCTVALGWASDRVGQRGIFIAGVLPTAIIGFAMLRWTESADAKYAAVFLNAISCFAASAGMLSWGINNAGNPAAAAEAGGYIVAIGKIGGVASTWTYLPTGKPEYDKGHTIFFGLMLFCFALSLFEIAHCVYENKMRASGKRDHRLDGITSDEAKLNMGHRNPEFRYML